jgi:hypothetical protein
LALQLAIALPAAARAGTSADMAPYFDDPHQRPPHTGATARGGVGAGRGYGAGMVERLRDMSAGTAGFRFTGEVERDDYEDVLVPELDKALDGGQGLRTLHLIEDLEEIEPGALWADADVGFDLGVRHHSAWVRSAIVTDMDWMAPRGTAVRVDDPGRGTGVRVR